MIQNKIVIRYQDGRLMKGITNNFFPNKDVFHVVPLDSPPGTKPLEVSIPDLKAILFVREFDGNPEYDDKKDFGPNKSVIGRKIKVVFKDGELLVGTTNGYQPNRPGFFIEPADMLSNILRCFVVTPATREVSFI